MSGCPKSCNTCRWKSTLPHTVPYGYGKKIAVWDCLRGGKRSAVYDPVHCLCSWWEEPTVEVKQMTLNDLLDECDLDLKGNAKGTV